MSALRRHPPQRRVHWTRCTIISALFSRSFRVSPRLDFPCCPAIFTWSLLSWMPLHLGTSPCPNDYGVTPPQNHRRRRPHHLQLPHLLRPRLPPCLLHPLPQHRHPPQYHQLPQRRLWSYFLHMHRFWTCTIAWVTFLSSTVCRFQSDQVQQVLDLEENLPFEH